MYSNDKACVKNNNRISETFDINQGVRQGCVLSPLLFNIFMADLPKLLDSSEGFVKVGDMKLSSLALADDIVILSETEGGGGALPIIGYIGTILSGKLSYSTTLCGHISISALFSRHLEKLTRASTTYGTEH